MATVPYGPENSVGHIIGDILARWRRSEGFEVLFPMGWDAFGESVEDEAIRNGITPGENARSHACNFREQDRRLGLSYDWSREINTSDPGYYRWTQWLFKRLFDRGLAYQAELPVWWCEDLRTVLANEEVINGRSERGNFPCVRRL